MATDPSPSEPIRWRRVVLEGFVIVSSILLALGAEALWQERNDRAEEQVVLTALHTEFVGNQGSLRAQSDGIDAAIALVASAASMRPSELVRALDTDEEMAISMAIRRPWTVEFRVGALEGTLGTQRASLIRNHQLLSDLTQYQAVRHELGEIGDLVTTVAVESFIASNQLPERHDQLMALLETKLGYWDAYQGYLGRLIAKTDSIATQLEMEIR